MRAVFRWSLIACILMSTQGHLLLQGLFVVRKAYIAEHLCENRHLHHMDCEGMCFLKDHGAAERTKQQQAVLLQWLHAFTLWADDEGTPIPAPTPEGDTWRNKGPDDAAQGVAVDIFRPPRKASAVRIS